jgi:DNA-binding NarL/FixJ family response regulator
VATDTAALTAADRLEALTPRQRDVLELVAEGLTNEEIGRRLYIAADTVRIHVGTMLGVLGVANRTQAAVLYATEMQRREFDRRLDEELLERLHRLQKADLRTSDAC